MKSLLVVYAVAVILAPVVLVGCSGMQAQSDYDPTVEFDRYQTWNWLPEPEQEEGVSQKVDELTHARIRTAIEKRFDAKGITKNAENPDFFVVYHGGTKDTMTMTQTTDTYKDYPYSEFDWSYAYSYEWRQGFLEIDIFDAVTRKLAWKGSVEAEVKPTQDPEKKTERITKAVDTILGKFPPGK